MPFKPGQSGHPGRSPNEKAFTDTLRLVLAEEDPTRKKRKLRVVVERLVDSAMEGQSWAIQQVADRIDGKPAQETTLNVNNKHDRTDWSREELVEIIRNGTERRRASGGGVSVETGRRTESDQVH